MVVQRRRSKSVDKKSKELRKYEIAYNKCIKLGLKSKTCKRSKKLKLSSKKIINKSLKNTIKKLKLRSRNRSRSLNAYQKFVKRESAKSVSKGRNVKSRMRALAKLWRKLKSK